MTASKAKIQANARYNAKAYDVIQARVPKAELINDRIALAIKAGKAKSKAEYILLAIKAQLRKDGLGE